MKINLSDGEWKLMNHLWAAAPKTITELTSEMSSETGWTKNTIITMLSRLEAKGAIHHEDGGRAKLYSPLIPREDAALAETKEFLGKVFGGSLGLMVHAMVESRTLTEADIAELSAILEEAGGEKT